MMMLTDAQWAVLEPLVEQVSAACQGAAVQPAAHDQRDPLAARQRRQVAFVPAELGPLGSRWTAPALRDG